MENIIKKGHITNEIAVQLYKENINNYDAIKLLLQNNIYQNIIDDSKKYPINYCNNIDIYKLLYLNDKIGYLHKALIHCNNIEVLHFLLEKDAIIDNLYFINTKNIKIIEYILQNKLKHKLNNDILFYENSIIKIELYIKYNGIDKKIINETNINIFNYDILKILLDHNVNVQDDILFYVNKYEINEYYKIVELFLNKGININHIKNDRNLLFNLDINCRQYYKKTVFLIKKGININYKDSQNRTILFYYCLNQNININNTIIDLYISYGLDINHLDKYNRNILFYQSINYNNIKILLKYKVNINIKDIYGNTIIHNYILSPLHCVYQITYINIFLKFINIDELNNDNNTILHLLCKYNYYYTLNEFTEMSKLFITKYNANTYQENSEGLIPYDILLKSNVKLDDTMTILYTEIKSNTKSANKRFL